MADLNPWLPQAGVPLQTPGALDQFGNFMDDPRARAALLSFGIAAMQPPAYADNPTSQLARALGTAGESVNLVDQQAMREAEQGRKEVELGIKGQEADSKQDLRAAQADSAVARADAATTRAAAATDRLGMTQQQMELRKQYLDEIQKRNGIAARLRVQAMYNKELEAINEENQNPLNNRARGFIPKPIPTFDQWVAGKPEIAGLLGSLSPLGDTGGTIPAPSATTPPSPVLTAPINPALPKDPKARRPGQVYSAPNGSNVQWDGKGLITVP